MPNQLIPPPEIAACSVKHLPLAKRIELWSDLVNENEALLLAGLRAKVGAAGELPAAYRQWLSRQLVDHDRKQVALLENLSRREARNGG
jgi:hypothetical protein